MTTNCHLFACRLVLQLECMHRIWFEAQFAALAFEFATALRGNSKHRLQSVHNQTSLLCSRPSNCHVTRRSKFMNLHTQAGKQAGRQTHERSCCRCTFHRPRLSAFLPVLAVCFFLSLCLAPLMEVLVKLKVKAYTGLHYDLYLNAGKICRRF